MELQGLSGIIGGWQNLASLKGGYKTPRSKKLFSRQVSASGAEADIAEFKKASDRRNFIKREIKRVMVYSPDDQSIIIRPERRALRDDNSTLTPCAHVAHTAAQTHLPRDGNCNL
jgi:hypothetical protein